MEEYIQRLNIASALASHFLHKIRYSETLDRVELEEAFSQILLICNNVILDIQDDINEQNDGL
ncbi:hypothetical protein CQA49_06815 [Helicobacter sp. MIT 00-7814]|uniref:hypothetical protein n=1 Tax=unclassified Helicobacter TaxID=2593540 RepID=UPI000E1F9C41|nr:MULTISPECIES: hypothetical protein [unclassified Helicobacter]RDU53353.1 hypothetical protein CQA49_06815 [Helicobacter sp. MIT 00-7814]RDU54174.1 hypothetical protein CQA37_06055 [Helicobacter sp. MIT 99-10781]